MALGRRGVLVWGADPADAAPALRRLADREAMKVVARTPRSRKNKGRQGEIEVMHMFRDAGYTDAARAPGSGAYRPYGSGDLSPWPGDLAFVKPWLVEVKYAEASVAGGERTWPGSTFIKATLRDLSKLADRRNAQFGIRVREIPVLFTRANFEPWRVFVRDHVFHGPLTEDVRGEVDRWVEVDQYFFFAVIEPHWRDRG